MERGNILLRVPRERQSGNYLRSRENCSSLCVFKNPPDENKLYGKEINNSLKGKNVMSK